MMIDNQANEQIKENGEYLQKMKFSLSCELNKLNI